jgi:membrane protease YdiL (CAAX protease family)
MEKERTYKRIGMGMACGYLAYILLLNILPSFMNQILPDANLASFLTMLINIGSILLISWLIVRKIPVGGKPEGGIFDRKTFVFYFFFAQLLSFPLAGLFTNLQNMILNFCGVGDYSALQQVNKTSSPVGMFFAMIFVGPVLEELIFRKILFERLRVYGSGTAVIITAILFGLYHGNIEQIPYATCMGIILGSIMAITGDIRLTILFHFINNLLSGLQIVSMATLSPVLSSGINHMIDVVPPLVGLVLIIRYLIRSHGIFRLPEFMERTDHTEVRAFFRTKGAIIYIVLVVLLAVLNFATPLLTK